MHRANEGLTSNEFSLLNKFFLGGFQPQNKSSSVKETFCITKWNLFLMTHRERERRDTINNKSVDNKHGNKNFYFDVFLIRITFNNLYNVTWQLEEKLRENTFVNNRKNKQPVGYCNSNCKTWFDFSFEIKCLK